MKATSFISIVAVFVMLTGTACADRQDYDASQGAIAGGAGTQEQTNGAKNSMGIGSNPQNQHNTNQNTQGNQPNNTNPSTPSDDNSSDKPVLPVPMQ